MNEPRVAVRIRDVHKRFGRVQALRGVDLDLRFGETTTLLGRNGAGKSTLLKLCAGIERADRGRVEVLGVRADRRDPAVMRQVGYVPDRPDLRPGMSGRQALRLVGAHYPDWDPERADQLVDLLRVPLDRRLRAMSRGEGMKLMLMLVLAVAHHPRLLLLDEPFGGLDPLVREEVLRGVLDTVAEPDRAVVLVTHDLDVALRVSDRLLFLEDGQVARTARAEEFTNEAGSVRGLRECWQELAMEARS